MNHKSLAAILLVQCLVVSGVCALSLDGIVNYREYSASFVSGEN